MLYSNLPAKVQRIGDSENSQSRFLWQGINLAVSAGAGAAALAWAVKADNVGVASLHVSGIANQLALLQACQQTNSVSILPGYQAGQVD